VQPTLFDQSPLARHRHSDPNTSMQAAASQQPGALEVEILEAFAKCPSWDGLTDDELVHALSDRYGPTVKTARSRLAKRGFLVANGDRRRSSRGAWMAVWVSAHRAG
jgi:hypothetical protein